MAMRPVSLRLDEKVLSELSEGSRRTSLPKIDLIRRTLRLHLRSVIKQESRQTGSLTSVKPWPAPALRRAYRRIGKDWDGVEVAAAAAQAKPRFGD